MNSFSEGFLSFAKENGLPSEEATRILKRAFDHANVESMFKSLAPDDVENPEELDFLNNLSQQDLIDQEMQQTSNRLYPQ